MSYCPVTQALLAIVGDASSVSSVHAGSRSSGRGAIALNVGHPGRLDCRVLASLRRVERAVRHQLRPRELGDDAITFRHPVHWLGDHLADHSGREIPFRENRMDGIFMTAARDDQHPLL